MAHFTGPCLTLAGPGSGKTHTLTCRIRHLIDRHQVPPEKILVITFTRAAALEMRQRFVSLMGEDLPVVFGTFHSVFFRMLQEEYGLEADALATGKMRLQLLREAASRCHIKSDRQDFFQIISREFSYIKNTGVDPAEYHSREFPGISMGRFFDAYEKQKETYGLLDFDDMLTKTFSMFRENPRILENWRERFSFYLLDEVQDMNRLQFQIVRLLAYPHNNLFAVGDDAHAPPVLSGDFLQAFQGGHDGIEAFLVERAEAAVKFFEVFTERFRREFREKSGLLRYQAARLLRPRLYLAERLGFGIKDDDHAALQLSLAVAAPRRLRYRVQLRECAPNDGKVHVNSGLNELRRNDADALAAPQLPFYFRYQSAYLLAAHEARELNRPIRHELRKLAAVLSLVDYAENLTLL